MTFNNLPIGTILKFKKISSSYYYGTLQITGIRYSNNEFTSCYVAIPLDLPVKNWASKYNREMTLNSSFLDCYQKEITIIYPKTNMIKEI